MSVKKIKNRVKELELDQWINEYNEYLTEINKYFPNQNVTMSDREWKPIKKQLLKMPRDKWLKKVSGNDRASLFIKCLQTITILIKSLKYDVTSPKSLLQAGDELDEVHKARLDELLDTDSEHEKKRKLGVWLAFDMMNIASVLAHIAASHFDDNEELQNSLMVFYNLIPCEAL